MAREHKTDERRLGWQLIGGAGIAVAVMLFALYVWVGIALDEDPTNNGQIAPWEITTYAAMICAPVMLLGGIVTLWQARRERKAQPASPQVRSAAEQAPR